LEILVQQIEKYLLPQGFEVRLNRREIGSDGKPVAEFDIEITGKLGSGSINCLIECRDRPSDGPAPGSWIEQLVGRRDRFNFNRVTAVSTTGFSEGAAKFAREKGIELRSVNAIRPEDVTEWLALKHLTQVVRQSKLEHIEIFLSDSIDPALQGAVDGWKKLNQGKNPIFRSTETGQPSTAAQAFLGALSNAQQLFEQVEPNGSSKKVHLRVQYPNDASHFVIDTDAGPVRIQEIVFHGELSVFREEIPVKSVTEYREYEHPDAIAQVAAFGVNVNGATMNLEFHKVAATGETHVVLRRVD
jgi:hypothetical protein